MDLLEYDSKINVKPFLKALLNQRETFYEYNIDIFKDFFTVLSIAKHMLARFSEMYYQYEFKSDMNSIKIDRDILKLKLKIILIVIGKRKEGVFLYHQQIY